MIDDDTDQYEKKEVIQTVDKKSENQPIVNKSIQEKYSKIIVPEGLVAYYPFNGNANDESNNSNDGIVTNAVLTKDRFGNPNSAYQFDGNNSEIICGNDESINLTSKLTISLKFRVDGYPKTISPLVYKGWISGSKNVFNGIERTYSLWAESTGLIHLTSADSRGQQFINTPKNSIKLNTWYHYIGIIDRENGIMKSYLDGKLIASGKIRKTRAVTTTKPLLIGSTHEKYNKFSNFKGVIEDVKIYNRHLTNDEVTMLFNE